MASVTNTTMVVFLAVTTVLTASLDAIAQQREHTSKAADPSTPAGVEQHAAESKPVQACCQFEIIDPANVHVQAVRTGSPLEFAWWVYIPKGYSPSYLYMSGTTAFVQPPLPPIKESTEFILRVKLHGHRELIDIRFRGGEHFSGSVKSVPAPGVTGTFPVGAALAEPKKLIVTQTGLGSTATYAPKDEILFLEIDPPTAMDFVVFRLMAASGKDYVAELDKDDSQ